MFAQDAFVQVRLKERKSYAKDKAVHFEQLIFYVKINKNKNEQKRNCSALLFVYVFFFFFEPILFSVWLKSRFTFSLCATTTITVKTRAMSTRIMSL